MSCDVAALPFQAHAYYGTCSIDFDNVDLDFFEADPPENALQLKISYWKIYQ